MLSARSSNRAAAAVEPQGSPMLCVVVFIPQVGMQVGCQTIAN